MVRLSQRGGEPILHATRPRCPYRSTSSQHADPEAGTTVGYAIHSAIAVPKEHVPSHVKAVHLMQRFLLVYLLFAINFVFYFFCHKFLNGARNPMRFDHITKPASCINYEMIKLRDGARLFQVLGHRTKNNTNYSTDVFRMMTGGFISPPEALVVPQFRLQVLVPGLGLTAPGLEETFQTAIGGLCYGGFLNHVCWTRV